LRLLAIPAPQHCYGNQQFAQLVPVNGKRFVQILRSCYGNIFTKANQARNVGKTLSVPHFLIKYTVLGVNKVHSANKKKNFFDQTPEKRYILTSLEKAPGG
jgi:hypothetical protein